MKHGISLKRLTELAAYAKAEGDKHVRLERAELHLIIQELKGRRRESKKLRLKRNKQTRQILNLAARL